MNKYISKVNVPFNKLPIYFCDIVISVSKDNRRTKAKFYHEFKKVVLKGLNESDLKNQVINKKDKYLTKKDLKDASITDVKISVIRNLGFGILE
jgi:hypothetical protein